jgi:enoyl-CoA hydratase/carnithine racemase
MTNVEVQLEDRATGRVAWVRMDNQSRLNAGSLELVEQLKTAFETLAGDDELRAVVLTGAGDRAFMAGADLNDLAGLDPDSGRNFITRLHHAAAAIRALPVPVIGRLRGFCLGAGLELAAACDFRVADETFVMGMPEVKVGLPSVIEAALLPRLIGWGRTREMLLTGVNYDANEALAMHFVEKLVVRAELDNWVEVWLGRILEAGPVAVRAQKALIGQWEELGLAASIKAGIDTFSDAYKTNEPNRMLAPFMKPK